MQGKREISIPERSDSVHCATHGLRRRMFTSVLGNIQSQRSGTALIMQSFALEIEEDALTLVLNEVLSAI